MKWNLMSQLSFFTSFPQAPGSAHGYGHIDAKVSIVGKQLGDAGVEHEAVRVEDSGGYALVYWPWGGLPCQPPPVTV